MEGTENPGMGSVIRRLRTDRGWTQEALAEQLHLTPQSVSRWETGQSLPDVSQVPQLARVFGVSTDTLYGLDQPEEDALGPELVLSQYSSAESAPTYADWSRLASLLRAGDPAAKRSTVRWTFLSLALALGTRALPSICRKRRRRSPHRRWSWERTFPRPMPGRPGA